MIRIISVLGLIFVLLLTVLLFLDESFFYGSFGEVPRSPYKPESLNHPLMKSKVIWLYCDAYSTYLTGDLSTFSNHSAFYHINNLGYPQSAAIASTQLLGRESRNYVGNFISEETIIDQLSTHPFSVVASSFPILGILGTDRFKSIKENKGREKYPLSRINYNNILPLPYKNIQSADTLESAKSKVTTLSNQILEQLSLETINNLLNMWTDQKELNFMYYTTIMDSYNHNYAGLDSITLAGASLLLADIKAIVTSIENSDYKDEYILIVSSDHGGQLYLGEDEICNHGCQMDKGNEGFLYIYSFGTDWAEDWITNEDVAAIIAGYTKNAGIPAKAKGWPRKIKNNGKLYLDELSWNMLRTKELQLRTVLGLEEAPQMQEKDFLEYLRQLEKDIEKKNTNLAVLIGIWILCAGILWKIWTAIRYHGFWLVFEHFCVVLMVKEGNRIERVLFWPVFWLNFVNILVLSWENWVWGREEKPLFTNFKHKLRKWFNKSPGFVVSALNIWFLATKAQKFDPEQVYTYYYLHYFLLFSSLVFLYSKIESNLKIFLGLFSGFLLGLMMYYEVITDYSMTDQTEMMILVSRTIYLSIFGFTVFLMFLPKHFDKRKLFGLCIVFVYFFVASQKQRLFFCCYFLPAGYLLMVSDRVKELLLLGISGYLITLGTFGFDISLRAGNHSWGVIPDDFPIFTGFLFGIHKLSWLILSGCLILGCPSFDKYFTPLILRGFLAVLIFLYLFLTQPSSSLSAFMWCMGQNLSLLISHSLGLLPNNNISPLTN